MRPPLWSSIDTGYINPYTCRTLLRVDEAIWRLRGVETRWGGPNSGRLIGGNSELRSHFPGWMFKAACYAQNRCWWTRKVFSL